MLFFFFTCASDAQVLDNRMGEAFTDKPFFNVDFIKDNNLKALKGTFVYKKQGEVMRTTEYSYVYNFNRNGHLSSTYETRKDDGTVDTTWNKYEYDGQGRLSVHRRSEKDGYLSTHYTYDSLDRAVKEEYFSDIIDSSGQIVRSLSFNTESFIYADYGDQKKRTRFNNYNLPYLDEFYNYNEDGYLIERIEKFRMTSKVYTYHYAYNDNGKVAAIRKTSNKEEGVLEEFKFKYDDLGNLIEKHLYRKGVFTTDIQIIYNSKSKLLSSVITRQVSTNFMMILRFLDYEFWD